MTAAEFQATVLSKLRELNSWVWTQNDPYMVTIDRESMSRGIQWAIETVELHPPDPEPDPQPTAAEVLLWAHERALVHGLSAEMQIIGAALTYAEDHPAWFTNWHRFEWTTSALLDAANKAEAAGDGTADLLLCAAARVASAHPHLFGGAE